eukprot:2474198-Rhodomonas_salina.6
MVLLLLDDDDDARNKHDLNCPPDRLPAFLCSCNAQSGADQLDIASRGIMATTVSRASSIYFRNKTRQRWPRACGARSSLPSNS